MIVRENFNLRPGLIVKEQTNIITFKLNNFPQPNLYYILFQKFILIKTRERGEGGSCLLKWIEPFPRFLTK